MIDLNHRDPSGIFNHLIDAAVKAKRDADTPRSYLGASMLGDPCARKVQFTYFNTPKDGEGFSGRAYRIFSMGHWSEDETLRFMALAGFDVSTINAETGYQHGFSWVNGRIKGHCDGIVLGGPERMGPYPRLFEHKCVNSKTFAKYSKEKLEKANPTYYAQVQIYMHAFGLTENPGMFVAMNKDNCEYVVKDIPFNAEACQRLVDRAARILQACDYGELMPPLSRDPLAYFECKFCDYQERCNRLTQEGM